MKTLLQLLTFIALLGQIIFSQPIINGDMNDASYTTLASFTSGRNGAGNDDDLGIIKYHSDESTIYIGVTGEISGTNYILLFFDFSGYKGRGNNILGVGNGIFNSISNARMDFDVDYALAFSENNTVDNFTIDGCRYSQNPAVLSSGNIGVLNNQTGNNSSFNTNLIFGGNGNITVAYHNGFAGNVNKGIEFAIPISAFNGVTNAQAVRVFAIIVNSNGSFYNESIPGDPGINNPGVGYNFSAVANQKFFTSYAPLVFGITFEGRIDFYLPGGRWMGDLLDETPFRHNLTCLYSSCGFQIFDCGTYAYTYLNWNTNGIGNGCSNGSGYNSFCNAVVENTDFLNDASGIRVQFNNQFTIMLLQNRNWGLPDDPPNGQMGDRRVYLGSWGNVYVNDAVRLATLNPRITIDVSYPTPYGTGDLSVGEGLSSIDNANSDITWRTKFNNGNNQVQFVFFSFSPIVQSIYGAFEYTMILRAAPVRENLAAAIINGPGQVNLSQANVNLNIQSVNLSATHNRFMAREVFTNPGGNLPAGINAISDYNYWELGTSCNSIQTDVVFDISSIPGIINTNNLRILKRESANKPWEIYGNYTLPGQGGLSSTQIRANNLSSFSEFAIGSTDNNPLPVELQNFNVSVKNDKVILTWQTATEVNNYGFSIERTIGIKNKTSDNWETIAFLSGAGNSNSIKNYFYEDNDITGVGKIYYRLKQIDTDGSYNYSEVIMVELLKPVSFVLHQNYPNPFNPTTKISWQSPVGGWQTLKVYDILGKEVATLVNEYKESGYYEVEFHSSNSNYQLASGIYFYKIEIIGENNHPLYTKMKKMVVTK